MEEGGIRSYLIGGTRFDLPSTYTPSRYVNQGAYGVVCAGTHNATGTKVAVKKIPNAFVNVDDTKRVLREIKLLRHLQHENVISIGDILVPPSRSEFEDIYIVSELMDTDLQQIIGSDQVLSEEHIQYFIYQVLCAVKYIHSANVIHRDIKPSNILCNEDCTIKLADFGLARVVSDSFDQTEYVATRWYRAPEVILAWKKYTKAIDVWSVGCIFAELFHRKPIFPGTNYVNQIVKITDILGTPNAQDIQALTCDQAKQFLYSLGYKHKVPWQTLFPNASPMACDLLERMLTFNPEKRCSIEEAISHPYFNDIRDPDLEYNAEELFSFEFEKAQMTKEMYQNLFFQEILYYHPEAANLSYSSNISQLPLSIIEIKSNSTNNLPTFQPHAISTDQNANNGAPNNANNNNNQNLQNTIEDELMDDFSLSPFVRKLANPNLSVNAGFDSPTYNPFGASPKDFEVENMFFGGY